MKTEKKPRKGLTKKQWIDMITQCYDAVGEKAPEIVFGPDGIEIDKGAFSIGFADQENNIVKLLGEETKVVVRGYTLTLWFTIYSYIDGPDVSEVDLGFYETPFKLMEKICRTILDERLSSIFEGITMEQLAIEEARYEKAMSELPLPESSTQNLTEDDDWRERQERHNRQVLRKL